MDPESPLTLDHGIPDPETYLPGTPPWVWWLVAAGVILVLLLLWLLARHLNKSKPRPPTLQKRDFYGTASQSLRTLESDCETRPLAEIAAHCSLALRGYLASSMSEPALYETVEEFKARQPDLPREAEDLLTDLNDAKYARSTVDAERASGFIERSLACLKTIHAAQNVTT